MGGYRGEGRGWLDPLPPLVNYKAFRILSNTGLETYKATQPAFNVGPASAHQGNTI